MTQKELKEKICEISNSEFPLIDFFNDIELNNNENFNKERAYKNNEVMTRDLNELINRNLELKQENQGVADDNTRLWHSLECANNENAKLKKAIEILKKYLGITFYDESCQVYFYEDERYADFSCLIGCEEDEYLLLKQAFESVGDSDE